MRLSIANIAFKALPRISYNFPSPREPAIARLARSNKLRLLPLAAATYFMVAGGPYGLEDVLGKAGYLRAHKQEKFLVNSILTGVFMALSTYILGKKFGPIGMASGYLAVNVVIGLGLGTFTFLHYRKIWHSA